MINFAPELDELLAPFEAHATVKGSSDPEMLAALKQIKTIVSSLKPIQNDPSCEWKFWIPLPCGNFKDYLNKIAKEESVNPKEISEELKHDWKWEYPEKIKWYRLAIHSYINDAKKLHISLDYFYIMLKDAKKFEAVPHSIPEQKQLVKFIFEQLNVLVKTITTDPVKYQKYLDKNLSKRYRFGKIKRSDYWDAVKEAYRLDKKIGKANIRKFAKALPKLISGGVINKITANDFFNYCAIGYAANHYEKISGNLTPREQYKRMADMRDEGLTQIKGNSANAFSEWYHSNRGGGHPWEICRGGTTTHIDLYVRPVNYERNSDKWELLLKGSSLGRAIETIKMAIALEQHGVPIILHHAKELLAMITGEDYIGIVPFEVDTKYCQSFFPGEEDIIDFINPWYDIEDISLIEKYIQWYPLDENEISLIPA